MEHLAIYFSVDHIQTPNPSILQRNVLFNIMYYLCRRGKENLHSMTKNWFSVIDDGNGDCYVMLTLDEMDKNHKEDDTQLTNQGRMYSVKGTVD